MSLTTVTDVHPSSIQRRKHDANTFEAVHQNRHLYGKVVGFLLPDKFVCVRVILHCRDPNILFTSKGERGVATLLGPRSLEMNYYVLEALSITALPVNSLLAYGDLDVELFAE